MSNCKCHRNVRIRNNPDGTVTRDGKLCQWCLEEALAEERAELAAKINSCKNSAELAEKSESIIAKIDKVEELKTEIAKPTEELRPLSGEQTGDGLRSQVKSLSDKYASKPYKRN